jgi:endonuclease YncB( thermonuclease family)
MDPYARPSRYRTVTRFAPPRRRAGRSYLTALLVLAGVCAVAANIFNKKPAATPTALGDIRVVDGDSLRAGEQNIRLIGIDAPERHQTCRDARNREWACGAAATARLGELVAHGKVACTPHGRDRYGRTLAVCAAGGIADIGRTMVREGYAVNYSFDAQGYAAEEDEARAAGRGLWQGAFERPQDYRRRHTRAG